MHLLKTSRAPSSIYIWVVGVERKGLAGLVTVGLDPTFTYVTPWGVFPEDVQDDLLRTPKGQRGQWTGGH